MMRPLSFLPLSPRRAYLGAVLANALLVAGVGANELAVQAVSTAASGDEAAFSTAIDGDRVVVGLPGAAGQAGAALIFDCSATPCVEAQRLALASPVAGDAYGQAVAVSGDVVAIGAPRRGSVSVYRRSGATWNLETTLAPPSGSADGFGAALALSGSRLAVGAPAAASASGRVDVFLNSGAIWSLEQSLAPPAAGGRFGSSVALDGATAIAGAPFLPALVSGSYARGGAYVYLRSGVVWSLQATLQPVGLADGDLFGHAVALQLDRAVVGAPKRAAERGSAFVFERTGTAWNAGTELVPGAAAAGDDVGWAVAVSGARVVLGAPYASADPGGACGRLDVFDRIGGAWVASGFGRVEQSQLGQLLGWSLAFSGDRLTVGAPGHALAGGTHQGALYRFDPNLRLFLGTFDTPADPCAATH